MIQHRTLSYLVAPGLMPGLRLPGRRYSIEMITAQVCDYFDVKMIEVFSKSRQRRVVECRHICMFFVRKLTTMGLKEIGEYFGHRDHTTVLYSVQAVKDIMDVDPEYLMKIDYLNKIL